MGLVYIFELIEFLVPAAKWWEKSFPLVLIHAIDDLNQAEHTFESHATKMHLLLSLSLSYLKTDSRAEHCQSFI